MKLLKAIALGGIGLIGINIVAPSAAIQLPNGGYAFENSPRLLDAMTTFKGVRNWGAKYYFTVELPEDVGEPLQKIIINQRQGGDEVDFYLDRTFAFTGTNRSSGEEIPISSVTQDEQTGAITVLLDSAVEPGKTFTLGLRPKRNPRYPGVYLFGVTVAPPGENSSSLYLGAGRLQFYRGGDLFNH